MEGRQGVSATICALTGALVKFVGDIGTEHQDFLKPMDGLLPLTRVMTKRIYDQLQEFDWDTLWYSVLILVGHNNSERKWDEIVMQVHGSGDEDVPLHLKIKAYYNEIARGDTQAIKSSVSDTTPVVPQVPQSRWQEVQQGKGHSWTAQSSAAQADCQAEDEVCLEDRLR